MKKLLPLTAVLVGLFITDVNAASYRVLGSSEVLRSGDEAYTPYTDMWVETIRSGETVGTDWVYRRRTDIRGCECSGCTVSTSDFRTITVGSGVTVSSDRIYNPTSDRIYNTAPYNTTSSILTSSSDEEKFCWLYSSEYDRPFFSDIKNYAVREIASRSGSSSVRFQVIVYDRNGGIWDATGKRAEDFLTLELAKSYAEDMARFYKEKLSGVRTVWGRTK